MPLHPDVQAAFDAGIRGGGTPSGLTAPGDVGRRFDVYRNNVAHSLREALSSRFPVIERIVGQDFFSAMAQRFVLAHPPTNPVLLLYGARFPDFIHDFRQVAHLPYLADVARLEWNRGEAYHAADADPVLPGNFAQLAGPNPEAAVLSLHPSVRVLSSRFPIVDLWQAHQPQGQPRAVRFSPQAAISFRSGSDVPVCALSAAEANFATAIGNGVPMGRALESATNCDARFDPGRVLGLLLGKGLIARVTFVMQSEQRRSTHVI